MKKVLGLCVGFCMLAATAGTGYALPLMWDVGAAGSAGTVFDADTLTGIFDQGAYASQTSTVQFDTDGDGDVSVNDQFLDSGNLRVNDVLAAGIIDSEGLNQAGGYEVTAYWDNVTGYVSNVVAPGGGLPEQLELTYTGGNIDFYLDTALNSVFANPAGTTPASGAGGVGFNDGTLIASLSLLEGLGNTFLGSVDISNQGSVELSLQFTYLLEDFWLNSAGIDLQELYPVDFYFATTDSNIDTSALDLGIPAGALWTAYSNQNGSFEVTVVPEPSTMLLLGGGLIGLAYVGRKRARKA